MGSGATSWSTSDDGIGADSGKQRSQLSDALDGFIMTE